MCKRITACLKMSRIFLMIAVSFLTSATELSAQKMEGFVLYQMNIFCGNSTTPKIFTYKNTVGGTPGRPLMGTHSFCVGKCEGRTVRLADALGTLPSHVADVFRWEINKHEAQAACGKVTSIAECIEAPKPKFSTAGGDLFGFPWQNGPDVVPEADLCPGCLWELATADLTSHQRVEDGDNALPPIYNPPKKLFCDYRYFTVWRCPVTQKITPRLELKTMPGGCGSVIPNW